MTKAMSKPREPSDEIYMFTRTRQSKLLRSLAALTATNFYQNDNGVGPNINRGHIPVRNMVLDSLKYWTNFLGADGFRFDLAAVLGNANAEGGYSFNRDDPDNILNRAVSELPVRPAAGGPGVDLIAEPYTADGQRAGTGKISRRMVGVERPVPRRFPGIREQAQRGDHHARQHGHASRGIG